MDAAVGVSDVAAPDPQAPRVLELEPSPGTTVAALNSVEVQFDPPVDGVDAADLLVAGLPAESVDEVSPGRFVFGFPAPGPGPVDFRWAPGAGIVLRDGPPLPFPGGAWQIVVDPRLAWRNVILSEFMADNDVALYDDDCDRSDWIELHNTGSTPVDLEGWSLTDDPAQPGQWRFPAYTLDANAHLIVFASEKNKTNLPPRACRTRTNSRAGFHTNFKLAAEGEYLALVAPDGEVISAFAPAYPPQRRDVSYGRVPGSPELAGYQTRPTPGAPNAASGDGFAPEIRFSRADGPFLDSFRLELTLATPSPGAEIRYTLDGSLPAETNLNLRTYLGPLSVTNTLQVRARSFAPSLLPGTPASRTYLRLSPDPGHLRSFTSSLPVIVLTTLRTATIGASANTPVHLSLFEPRDGRTTLLGAPTLTTRAGIKTRGSSTGGQPQSNFAVEWWDEFNQDRDLPVLGMPEDSEWVLYAPNEFDAALIHNPFTMELSRQMPFAAPQTRFVEVYLNRGGPVRSNDWFGLYVLMQKPGLAKGRIDAPKAGPEDIEEPEITGSYLFKTDRLDPGDAGFVAGGAANAYVEPKEREMRSPQRAPQLAYLQKYFRDLDNALRATNPDFRHPVRGYRGYLELTNWIDFHLLETLSGQVDAIRLSTYFYKRREGKLEYGPRWDYDRAWESKGDSRDNNPRVWDSGGGLFGAPWWNRVLADRDAWQLWIDRWHHHRQATFSRTNVFQLINTLTNQIRSVQPRENRRWTATAPRVSYANEIGIMKTWISNRLDWIDSQFAPAPILSSGDATVPAGFELTLRIPPGTSTPSNVAIFYTLDGTDPRPSGGTSAPTAFRYSVPIRITTNARVVARLRDLGKAQRSGPPSSSTWSAPAVATLLVSPPALAFTELMYHPEPPPAGSPYSEDDFEFLELRNLADRPVPLEGCQLNGAVQFRFPSSPAPAPLGPGQRLLLVRNLAAFRTRHPDAGRVAGEFTGNLPDSGGRLTLTGPLGEPIADASYADEAERLADGLGFALVLADPDQATPSPTAASPASVPIAANAWRRGARAGGSPGLADPDPTQVPTPPPVVISELLAAPVGNDSDWIELHHPGPGTADVSGWWITDDLDQPRKVRLPAGTVLAPGGYRVLRASLFQDGPGGFGLGADGDSIWLLSADADGTFTGWLHGFRFDASMPGRTWGRHTLPTGTETLIPESRPTPGEASAGAQVGPLVFGELLPRTTPLGDALGVRDAFLEIRNLSPFPVLLHDPDSDAEPWRIRGDLEFDFAADPVLPAGGSVVVVAFDPRLDRFETAAFRVRHRLSPDQPIVGPWRGRLDPDQPRLQLLPPTPLDGAPRTVRNDAGSESFAAQPAPPWPQTTSQDASTLAVVRRWPPGWAGDGAQWAAASPTPGEPDLDLDGLPDAWESSHALSPATATDPHGPEGDPDGDGFSNRVEWGNGTDPGSSDAGLPLRVFESGPQRVTALVHVPRGASFRVEATRTPEAGIWQPVDTATVTVDSVVVVSVEARSDSPWFYRIRRP